MVSFLHLKNCNIEFDWTPVFYEVVSSIWGWGCKPDLGIWYIGSVHIRSISLKKSFVTIYHRILNQFSNYAWMCAMISILNLFVNWLSSEGQRIEPILQNMIYLHTYINTVKSNRQCRFLLYFTTKFNKSISFINIAHAAYDLIDIKIWHES